MNLSKLGFKIIEEANNLKRTKVALSKELNISKETLEKVITGKCNSKEAKNVIARMLEVYPIDPKKLQLVDEKNHCGFTITNRKASKKSSRVFNRKNSLGLINKYYEYRDTAMQKNAPIYPEWIQPLVVVDNNNPKNKLVCYNKGHILHQFTFFIGEVNFYWKDSFGYHCKLMNTGDSNYIPPFIPHSFTSRNKKKLGLIIAVTFADILSFARSNFSFYNRKIIESFSGNTDKKYSYLKCFIENFLNANFMDEKYLQNKMSGEGIKEKSAINIISGRKKLNKNEIKIMSKLLNISEEKMKAVANNSPLEVINKKLNENLYRTIECDTENFKVWDLAKCKFDSLIKAFIMETNFKTKNFTINHRSYEYVYNFDKNEVIIKTEKEEFVLKPEESIVFSPMIKHSFYNKLKSQNTKILIVRVSEEFSEDFIDMFANLGNASRKKIFSEASQWF